MFLLPPVIIQPAPDPWWVIAIQLLSPLVALGIAVWTFIFEQERRKRENRRRQYRDARRVIWTNSVSRGAKGEFLGEITIINASDNPILSVGVLSASVGSGQPFSWTANPDAQASAPVLLVGDRTSFAGTWKWYGDPEKDKYDPFHNLTYSPARPELYWTDTAGNRWSTDNNTLAIAVRGDAEAPEAYPEPTRMERVKWWFAARRAQRAARRATRSGDDA